MDKPQPLFVCDLCGKTFRSKQTLLRHVRIHKYGKQFRCCYCEKSYTRRYLLTDHKLRSHGIEKAPPTPIWTPKLKVDSIIKRKYFRPSAASQLQLFSHGLSPSTSRGHGDGSAMRRPGGDDPEQDNTYTGENQTEFGQAESMVISNVQSLSGTLVRESLTTYTNDPGTTVHVPGVEIEPQPTLRDLIESDIDPSTGQHHDSLSPSYADSRSGVLEVMLREPDTDTCSSRMDVHPVAIGMTKTKEEFSDRSSCQDNNSRTDEQASHEDHHNSHNEAGADAVSSTDTEESVKSDRVKVVVLDEEHSIEQTALSITAKPNAPSTSGFNKQPTQRAIKYRENTSTASSLPKSHEQVKSVNMKWECTFCGIFFSDEVLFFLHKGFHSRSNPYQCNSCGHVCHNKYEFTAHVYSQKH